MVACSSIKKLAGAVLVVMAASACAGKGSPMDRASTQGYQEALERLPGDTTAIDRGVTRFRETFGDLTQPDLEQRLGDLYAESFYFNDTVHIARQRPELVDYLTRTGDALTESRVDVHRVIRDGADVYLRWEMTFVSRALGKRIESNSIGITHLRFDANGRVVLHQDFWDSGSALYAHLPVVGFFVRRARGAMQ